jgi:hypothetical protein
MEPYYVLDELRAHGMRMTCFVDGEKFVFVAPVALWYRRAGSRTKTHNLVQLLFFSKFNSSPANV